MRSFFPHASRKAHNEDAITVFFTAFRLVGAIAKKLWHNRRSFRVTCRTDGRRIQGTVAPHPESECSGRSAAFVHPTRASPNHMDRARTGCSPHHNVPAQWFPALAAGSTSSRRLAVWVWPAGSIEPGNPCAGRKAVRRTGVEAQASSATLRRRSPCAACGLPVCQSFADQTSDSRIVFCLDQSWRFGAGGWRPPGKGGRSDSRTGTAPCANAQGAVDTP
jgi:hypothetical protein